jgi:catechol 2,3-dioxygenase-like lactoylglutathione lyase family enzyme
LQVYRLGGGGHTRSGAAGDQRGFAVESQIEKLDFVAVPSRDAAAARAFYVETLGLRADARARYEFWVDETCFVIWEPASQRMPFVALGPGGIALHVADVATARAALEEKGIVFLGETIDTGVCHMSLFSDPDGNGLMLHHRYAPRV